VCHQQPESAYWQELRKPLNSSEVPFSDLDTQQICPHELTEVRRCGIIFDVHVSCKKSGSPAMYSVRTVEVGTIKIISARATRTLTSSVHDDVDDIMEIFLSLMR
jgi:hypothetical protein